MQPRQPMASYNKHPGAPALAPCIDCAGLVNSNRCCPSACPCSPTLARMACIECTSLSAVASAC